MSVFDDLVGQEPVVAQLRAAVEAAGGAVSGQAAAAGAMTHAWLFTGPPGSGRSVAARAFACALQCPDRGCGTCVSCHQAQAGTHPDIAAPASDELHLRVDAARELILRASRAPVRGRWQVILVEDADRMTDEATNALLKALEEPHPRCVFLLCAPSVEDLLPTVRSRCRVLPLRTPSAHAVARVLVDRDGVDPPMAAFAAQAGQGHIGRARRLATREDARQERQDVLALPRSLQGVGSSLAAAKALVESAQEEAVRLTEPRDAAERAALSTALGGGATGTGYAGSAPRGGAAALKDLEKRQKSRGTRRSRDALDRALVDLAGFYRDVLTMQLRTGSTLVHADVGEQAATIARATSAEATVRRIEAILACRTALEGNVAPQLAVEAMALALRTG